MVILNKVAVPIVRTHPVTTRWLLARTKGLTRKETLVTLCETEVKEHLTIVMLTLTTTKCPPLIHYMLVAIVAKYYSVVEWTLATITNNQGELMRTRKNC